ncbi:MAG: hypothetical protein JNM65_15065 [Verrucomicrobiaceae bacterium]|nr:hypothetical protein [Verrucomicrobiaceae bacterium]
MKTKTVSKPRRAVKRAPLRAKKYPKDASGLGWLLDEKLPPANQLPENPVLVLRRL